MSRSRAGRTGRWPRSAGAGPAVGRQLRPTRVAPVAGRGLRWAGAGLSVTLAGALLAGCGIPAGTDVRVDGPLPEAGSPQSSGTPVPPPGPDQADTAVELVEFFLQAAAADPVDPLAPLREFIHADERGSWQPDPQILVVRAEEPVPTPAGRRERVQVTVREVGVLTDRGTIEPRDIAQSREIPFEVVEDTEVTTDEDVGQRVGDPRFRLVDPPNEILLSTAALENGYLLPRPVYFWGSDGQAMVPDLRWLPRALADRQRPQRVLEWLEDGPAGWLPGALVGLPDDVALAGNVVWGEDRLEVALTAAASEVDRSRLEAQLWWTLRPELADRTLVLTIDGQQQEIDGDQFLAQNRTAREPPARFAVVDGVVRQQQPDAELDLPALSGDRNRRVHSAALTRDRRFAALVRPGPDGQFRLSVARPAGEVGSDLAARRMSRPVWLAGGETGLVVADGRLHRFGRTAETAPVRVPGELAGIQAVAAAPDGRRIALVAGGRLYVASMVWRQGSFSVNDPLVLPTTARDLQGVGFLQENWLGFVGQADGRSLLYEITVDGALERPLPRGGLGVPASIDAFTAFPGDPTSEAPRGEVMYEAESRAYLYSYGFDPVQVEADDLYGVPADSQPGEPRTPFFLD